MYRHKFTKQQLKDMLNGVFVEARLENKYFQFSMEEQKQFLIKYVLINKNGQTYEREKTFSGENKEEAIKNWNLYCASKENSKFGNNFKIKEIYQLQKIVFPEGENN